MWRRVSCEQPLDTSQSILRLSGSIVQWRGESFSLSCCRPRCRGHGRKGNRFLFLYPVA